MPEIFSTDLPNVMHEMIDEEVVIVNLESGSYYSLAGVAGQIWNLLGDDGCSMEVLVERMKQMYEGDEHLISTEVAKFLQELSQEKIISVTAGECTNNVCSEAPTPRGAFSVPVLEKYTDMEEMLLVDPIHEVSEEGWPQLK